MTETSTAPDDVDRIVADAQAAFDRSIVSSPAERAGWLRAGADALDAHADELVAGAAAETHLPARPRLAGELGRTTFQLRLFAQALEDGAYLDPVVDHADPDWPMGPRPDLRRELRAIGPVLVYAASNFPFAFSVAGGDTASALAAGCGVVIKAHPGHPELSERTFAVLAGALAGAGAPRGLVGLIHGQDAGVQALRHPGIAAAAFTGSVRGGRALFDIAAGRPRPIPFYGELGSVNPVVVSRAALDARAAEVVDGYVASFTLGAGQFCTKPGLVFVPHDARVEPALAEAVRGRPPAPLLNEHIAAGYADRLAQLRGSRAHVVAEVDGTPDAPGPTLLAVDGDDFLADAANLGEECFGPSSLVVTYRDLDHLDALLGALEPSLTATLQAEESDDELAGRVLPRLSALAGRVLWNGWPTGVTVSWAQQHGGPYPATTAPTTTSVGTAAITRFLRPLAWQGFPDKFLPPAVREDNPWRLPRRTDGER